MSQVAMSRPASQMKTGLSLPEIKHPLAQMDHPGEMDIRGVSRASQERPFSNPPHTGRPLSNEGGMILRKSFSALSGRQSKSSFRSKDHNKYNCVPIESIPEGVEVKHGDPGATRLPVFGNRKGMSDRDLESRGSSRMSKASTQARLEIDKLEACLKDKLKHNYYDVRKKFKDNDPEGRGNVSREAFTRILVTLLGQSISGNCCQRLMERLGFAERQIIPFTEFFAYFRQAGDTSYPQWMDTINRGTMDKVYMTNVQVHSHLKEKARQRFLDLADMIPQMNPGGSGRIMKSEFQQMLNKMNFHLDDAEFDKLWRRYDPANEGVINGQKLLNALGIEWKNGSDAFVRRSSDFEPITEKRFSLGTPMQGKGKIKLSPMQDKQSSPEDSEKGRTPRKKEIERRNQLDIEKWLKNKFREGFFNMREAFEDKDPERKGLVTFDEFIEVLSNNGLKLEKSLLGAFLSRCSVKAMGKGVPYREFLHRFQDRGEEGMTHNVLTDVKHRFNNNNNRANSVTDSTISAVETQVLNMFQRDFLALLGMFKKIDKLGTNVISQEEFRAAVESKFHMGLTDSQFASFVDRVPLDEDGNIKYTKFMQQFDARGKAPSLWASRSNKENVDENKSHEVTEEINGTTEDEELQNDIAVLKSHEIEADENGRRNPQELYRLIKDLLTRRFQEVEQKYYDLDDTNTRRLSQEMMYELLRSFDIRPEITRGEIRDLWKTFITNADKTLEYLQFVRHFGFSVKSAAFPNAKRNPPKRGDADFMMRSRKLNCAADMLQDSLRAKIDYMWDDLRREFINMDPYSTGYVTVEEFRDVLTELCVHLSNLELDQLVNKFQVKTDGRVSYIEFLKPFALRKQIWRHGNNMLSLLKHPNDGVTALEEEAIQPSQKGLDEITAKMRQKLAGEWKTLRRAFKKIDSTGNGHLSLPEFRSVLKLANVVLDEDEVYHVMSEFDKELTGKISYEKFLNETFKPASRDSIRSKQ